MQVATPKKGYKFVKTSYGKYEEIPEEWEITNLGNSCDILDSKRIPLNESERKKIQCQPQNLTVFRSRNLNLEIYLSSIIFNNSMKNFGFVMIWIEKVQFPVSIKISGKFNSRFTLISESKRQTKNLIQATE